MVEAGSLPTSCRAGHSAALERAVAKSNQQMIQIQHCYSDSQQESISIVPLGTPRYQFVLGLFPQNSEICTPIPDRRRAKGRSLLRMSKVVSDLPDEIQIRVLIRRQ